MKLIVLNAEVKEEYRSRPRLKLIKNNSTADILAELNYKKGEQQSRYSRLKDTEVSMYLRHTSIITEGASKTYGQSKFDPTATVEDYDEENFYESGVKFSDQQHIKLVKYIDNSFEKIKEVHVGMKKPAAKKGVVAKKVSTVFPLFELLNKPVSLTQFYDNPLKGIIPDKDDGTEQYELNNESILLNKDDKIHTLYTVHDKSRGALGKRHRTDEDDDLTDR